MAQISGDGFLQGKTIVTIGDKVYTEFISITFTSISIRTKPDTDGVKDVKVIVNGVEAISAVTLEFSSSIAPSISSVSPSSLDAGGVITLTGTNYGSDTSLLNVKVGSENCQVLTATETELTCRVAGVNLGSQAITINLVGVGNSAASTNAVITGVAKVSSIAPTSGSVNGGTLLTVSGNGFTKETSVRLDNAICTVVTASVDSLTCLTSAHSSQSVSLTVS